MKYFYMPLSLVFLGMGTATAGINQYKGTWTNSYANTGQITKMVFAIIGVPSASLLEMQ